MKRYIISYPQTSKRFIETIQMVLGEGGYIISTTQDTKVIQFTIECNNDTEFADLMVDVGRVMHSDDYDI